MHMSAVRLQLVAGTWSATGQSRSLALLGSDFLTSGQQESVLLHSAAHSDQLFGLATSEVVGRQVVELLVASYIPLAACPRVAVAAQEQTIQAQLA